MKTVERTTRTDITVAAPPSKAHTLRALFLSALADGRSVIHGPLLGKDQERAIECLRRLGVGIASEADRLVVNGLGGEFRPTAVELDVGESGVSMNFLAALACLSRAPVVITGASRITERPVAELVSGLRQLGCGIDYLGEDGFPPLKVRGGGIPGGMAEMRGQITSQYFSALLAAAPYADRPVTLRCTGPLTEKPYLGITMSMMADMGVQAQDEDFATFSAPNGQGYEAGDILIEGDYSGASFFFEAAAICRSRVTVAGLNPESVQGDRRFLALLERMGCEVQALPDGFAVQGRELCGIEADMADTPDLVPPLAVTAAFAAGETRLTNIAHLRHKECDRLAVIASELGKMGVQASCDESALSIEGGSPHGARIDPHNDHRIAMSFAIAGLAVGNQVIEDETCVAKSFPDFWDRLTVFG
ncbi:MAG: 3-phosphoshikimate 1-carboxyvinyltransferase [Planctomycetota bacterium]|jgi:3-phosphoshikimate 1-carboxyvinyltransferase